MKDEIFAQLLESVREGGTILRGEKPASRTFVSEPSDVKDVKRIRDDFKLSQREFAAVLGISIKTLKNWEQGRCAPQAPARVLLQVVAKHPETVWNVVRSPKTERSK